MNQAKGNIYTFFFTDIEGSTRLIQTHKADYAEILNKYRLLIRNVILQHNGREVNTAGDGFFIAFHAIDNAIQAAVVIQQKFQSED